MFDGRSGSGKSTICRAIHFVLFGGKKFRNVCNKGSNKKEKTTVTFNYVTPNKKYSIKRERPSETISVILETDEGDIGLFDKEAQSWICSEFGTEESWISSSYLAQEKDHFFIGASNSDKNELLKQITFGDLSEDGTPEFFTESLLSEISSSKNRNERLTMEINTHQFAIENLLEKNPDILKYGFFTKKVISRSKTRIKELNTQLKEIESVVEKINIRETVIKENLMIMEELNSMDLNKLKNRSNEFSLINEQIKVEKSLCSFNKQILDHSIDEINTCYLKYKDLIDNGWSKTIPIKEYIDSLKLQNDKYNEYVKHNNEILLDKRKNFLIESENNNLQKKYDEKVKEYKLFCSLSDELSDFDTDIFNISSDDLYRNKQLYELYFEHGYKNGEDINKFLKNKQLEYDNYLNYQSVNERNKIIIEKNKLKKSFYESNLLEYNIALNKKNKYDSDFLKLKNEQLYLESQDFVTFGDDDDETSLFLENIICNLKSLLNEQLCPCCNHGLIINNGKIIKGEIISENERNKKQKTLESAIKELVFRKRVDDFQIKEDNFVLQNFDDLKEIEEPIYEKEITCDFDSTVKILKNFSVPDVSYDELCILLKSYENINNYKTFKSLTITKEPIKPILEDLISVKELKEVFEPKIKDFSLPKYDYDEILSLYSSVKLIEKYKNWIDNPYSNITYSQEEFQNVNDQIKYCNELNNMYDANKKIIEENKHLEKVDEDSIQKIEAEIEELHEKVNIGSIALIYQEHVNRSDLLKEEQLELSGKMEDVEKICKFIEKIANSSKDDMIFSINESLELICNDLFDTPILITLSTVKELKNGKEKNEINLEIKYNGYIYDNANEMSGGERKRLSFALLLALMVVNASPICIMDEVLPSMESDLKTRALDTMSKFTKGKFIIHICHDICKGQHDQIIDFNLENDETIEEEYDETKNEHNETNY